MSGLGEWVATARAERWGLLADLTFAVAWVTMVDLLFRVLSGPDPAYYGFMLAGIVAYYLLVANVAVATGSEDDRAS